MTDVKLTSINFGVVHWSEHRSLQQAASELGPDVVKKCVRGK
ncbi:MAG: hypothetical protein ACLP5H_13110 [Desulfomonilaceae bacterium]